MAGVGQTTSSTYSFSSSPKAVGTRKKYREPGDVEPGLDRPGTTQLLLNGTA